jgi:hypothetical protein
MEDTRSFDCRFYAVVKEACCLKPKGETRGRHFRNPCRLSIWSVGCDSILRRPFQQEHLWPLYFIITATIHGRHSIYCSSLTFKDYFLGAKIARVSTMAAHLTMSDAATSKQATRGEQVIIILTWRDNRLGPQRMDKMSYLNCALNRSDFRLMVQSMKSSFQSMGQIL